jgi:hypothetical protein
LEAMKMDRRSFDTITEAESVIEKVRKLLYWFDEMNLDYNRELGVGLYTSTHLYWLNIVNYETKLANTKLYSNTTWSLALSHTPLEYVKRIYTREKWTLKLQSRLYHNFINSLSYIHFGEIIFEKASSNRSPMGIQLLNKLVLAWQL